jgi:predicted 3-demethylubiquinone-9 3-methyltransferase (glyoxalase superfamily)
LADGKPKEKEKSMSKITPCIWFANDAEEAARFYTSVIPNSRIDHVQRTPVDTPGNKAGDVLVVYFTLGGETFMALNGGQKFEHSYAVSFMIECEDQAEVDRLWATLSKGGKTEVCGWLKDRWGMSWQITPKILPQLIADPDEARAKRAMDAMMKMTKIDIAALKQAADGK